jgi:hypothetical protein
MASLRSLQMSVLPLPLTFILSPIKWGRGWGEGGGGAAPYSSRLAASPSAPSSTASVSAARSVAI